MADEIATLLANFGLSGEAFIGLLVIVLLIIGAVVVVIVSRPVLDIYPYLLPNARVRARKGRLFDEKQLSEIIESNDLNEITNYLRGFPDYAKYMDDYSLEKSLDIQLAETYALLARIAPADIKKAFVALAKKSDINNIKSLIAAKEANLDRDATINLLIPSGKLYGTLEHLVDVNNVEDIITGLDGTEYSSVLEDAFNEYEESKTILPLEAALDKYYLENLLSARNVPSNDNTVILYSYIGSQVDVSNLKIIIRAKVDGLNYESISPYIIINGHDIKEWKLKDLMEAEDVPSLINGLEGTDYAQILNETLNSYNETGSIGVFEKALDEYLADYTNSICLKNPIGIGPIIGFLTKKEREIKNLKVIARAKRENEFPIAEIQEMLV
ncbi:V-type ATP synthase subunit C [Methanobrevibacter cuticularis]|uniref:A-type ATP synthase subunit C n=1 Tax=Methanobrevibacter cuticularis TaxID=47311 RepID=A0A166CPR8_9EURY|nr:V-type ATP synthase subunit C [Methanobrevibacter cuticularis]KZX15887.1 V-type ATP synthase subunit C [Methanobrevibacter cuticularis]